MAATLTSYPVHIPLESLPIAAAALDDNGRILSANPRFRRLFGSAELRNLPRRLLDVVSESDRAAVRQSGPHRMQPPRFSFMALSNKVRWPLEAIRSWESFAAAGAIEVYALTGGGEDASTFIVRLPSAARCGALVSRVVAVDHAGLDAAAVAPGTA